MAKGKLMMANPIMLLAFKTAGILLVVTMTTSTIGITIGKAVTLLLQKS